MINNLKLSDCPICRSNDWKNDLEAGKMLGLSQIYHVLACNSCGQKKLDPQLGQVDQERLYSQGYFNSAGCEDSVTLAHELPANYLDIATGRQAKFLRTVLELKAVFPVANSFLDVGAATGDMVHVARNAGLDAEGIEFSEFAVNEARKRFGFELKRLSLSEVGNTRYDLIHLNHVFEHFNEPVVELKHLHRILKPDGGLYIEIPYQFNLIERLKYRLRPVEVALSLHSIHHPFFYTPRTIKRILIANNFRILKLRVFTWNRYPSETVIQKLKLISWWVLSWFDIGNYIELIVVKDDGGGRGAR